MPSQQHHKPQRSPLSQKTNAGPASRPTAGHEPAPPVTPNKNAGRLSQNTPIPTAVPSLDYKQIQQDEVEVLSSIFMDDYHSVKKTGAWNTSNPSFKLNLKASSDEEYNCVLSVTMTATYPKSVPELGLTPSSNLNATQRTRLEQIIKDLPRKLLGQEMIYEIATAVQDLLEDIVQNRLVDKDKPSLGEERALKAMSERKRAEEEEEEIRQKQELEAIEEQKKLAKEIEDELRRQREQEKERNEKRRKSSLLEDDQNTVDSNDCILFDRPIKIMLKDGPITFRKVCGMVKIAEGPVMTVYSVRPAFPAYEAKNTPLVLKQVNIPDGFLDCSEGKRQIEALEQELDSLRNLRHPNIIEIYESKVTRDSSIPVAVDDSCSKCGWRVSILTEYANKGSLHDLLETVDVINVGKARSWIISLLEGLDYIHRNGAVHNGIHTGNVLLSRRGPQDSIVAKFADISYAKSIRDVVQKESNFLGHAHAASWFPPEISRSDDAATRKMTRKSDIWYFGIVVVQLLFGLGVLETYDSPQKLLDSMDLSESLSDFLESIFRIDPKKRPTAFELLPSEFLRTDDPITSPASPRAPSPTLSRQSWPGHSNHHRHHSQGRRGSIAGGSLSRYANDFVQLGKLGKGGYGQVVKARNRLDGGEYAIKMITQRSGARLTEILSEVMLLSRLNHQYVVRYFTAWLEEEDSLQRSGFLEGIGHSDNDSTAISSGSGSGSGSGSSSGSGTVSNGSAVSVEAPQEDVDLEKDHLSIEFGSTGGLDFISSGAGYPKVKFGYSSDEDSEESESDDIGEEEEEGEEESTESASNKANALKRTISNERKRGKVTLYIQMSLAERLTLRDRIRQGIEIEECWKLLRQILEGLAHIHGLGIIHRDLKPENIFINLAGDPQIGDFGLATNELVVTNTVGKTGSNADSGDNELTTNVGTTLYVAPELRVQGQGNYNEKVDMYSLGIIFFEMCYPLSSGMERVQVLSKLREPDMTFPTDFWTEKRNAQGAIIKDLVSHDPAIRPSSTELLSSGKLPLPVEDRTIRDALLHSLSNPDAPHRQRVMQAIFSQLQNTKEYKDHTYDADRSQLSWSELILQSQVKEALTNIFRCHGAVETTRPFLLPRSKFYSNGVNGAVQLADSRGTLVQLPYDLTLSHARILARQSAPADKTFTFGTVFRENTGGGQPRSHGEVDFDIVSYDSLDLSLKEAEVIKVVDEVIDAFPSLRGAQMCFHINHSTLLDAIMDFCRIKTPQRAATKEILSRLNHRNLKWNKIRNELVAAKLGILPTSLDDLARFDWRDETEAAFDRLRVIFEGSSAAEPVQSVFVHIRAVVMYLRQFGVRRKIYLNPLGTWNDKFYRGGLVFQCIYDTKRRDVFAAGGRYDSLIQDHSLKAKGNTEETRAVGCNLAWEQLSNSMSKYHKSLVDGPLKHTSASEDLEAWTPRRCDVIVSSYDSTSLRTQGIALLSELWAANISAELGPSHALVSPDNAYKSTGITLIVTVKPASTQIRVRNIHTKQDHEVKHTELIAFLKGELSDNHHRPGKFARNMSSDTVPAIEEHSAMDVRILQSDRKGKKIARGTIIDAAQRAAMDTATGWLKCPVAAVDVKEDMLEEIKKTPLGDVEGWKKLVQGEPAGERKYIMQIQELLEELKGEGWKEAWVYGIRSGIGGVCYLV